MREGYHPDAERDLKRDDVQLVVGDASRYSPLWDVHLSTWAAGQQPTGQKEVTKTADLAAASKITAHPGGPWGATGFIVDCPIIARL